MCKLSAKFWHKGAASPLAEPRVLSVTIGGLFLIVLLKGQTIKHKNRKVKVDQLRVSTIILYLRNNGWEGYLLTNIRPVKAIDAIGPENTVLKEKQK